MQTAKTLEPTACTSLARLWRDQHRRTQAIELLDDLYAWFSDDNKSFDVEAARVLLKDLR